MEWNRCFYSLNHVLTERSAHGIDGFFTRSCDRDNFCNHGIVERWNNIPRIYMRIDAYSMSAWLMQYGYLTRTRPEIIIGILGIDSAFNRMHLRIIVFS